MKSEVQIQVSQTKHFRIQITKRDNFCGTGQLKK
jgi:hypothetical protein